MSRTEGRVRACRLTGTVWLHIPHSFPEADSPPGNAAGSWAQSPVVSAESHRVPGLGDAPQLPRAGIPWHWCRARQGSALLNDLLKPFLQWFSRGSDPSAALVLLCRVGVLCQGAVPPQGALLMPAAPRIPLSLTFACSRPSLQSRACPKQGARAGTSRGLSVLPDAS